MNKTTIKQDMTIARTVKPEKICEIGPGEGFSLQPMGVIKSHLRHPSEIVQTPELWVIGIKLTSLVECLSSYMSVILVLLGVDHNLVRTQHRDPITNLRPGTVLLYTPDRSMSSLFRHTRCMLANTFDLLLHETCNQA